jgi:hypothetical protein
VYLSVRLYVKEFNGPLSGRHCARPVHFWQPQNAAIFFLLKADYLQASGQVPGTAVGQSSGGFKWKIPHRLIKKNKLLKTVNLSDASSVTHSVNECGRCRIFPMKFLSHADADDDDGVGVGDLDSIIFQGQLALGARWLGSGHRLTGQLFKAKKNLRPREENVGFHYLLIYDRLIYDCD